MVIFAFSALAAALVPQVPASVSPARHAQATVTILTSSALRFSQIEQSDPKKFRETQVRAADGSVQTVRLVEFE